MLLIPCSHTPFFLVGARISPDQKTIVSVGSEGAVFMWEMPYIEQPQYDVGVEAQQTQQGW